MRLPVQFASLLCAILLFAFLTSGQATKVVAKDTTLQSKFQGLIDQYYALWDTGDPDKAAALYAKDSDLVFFDIAPLKYTGWQEYNSGVRKVLATFASAKFTPNQDLKVTRRGVIAWTTVTFHLSGKKQSGESVETDGRQTLIWEYRGGKWLIVHEHFSVPMS